jgi:hypothetical protein
MTGAVSEAIRERLDRVRGKSKKGMAERLMELFLKLPLVAVVAAGIMGTGLAFVVKFIVEANQTPHDRIPGVADDASRK